MASKSVAHESTGYVVGGLFSGVSRGRAPLRMRVVAVVVAILVALSAALWTTPGALADDQGDTAGQNGSGITITQNITDTENLLGSKVGEVTDAITSTKDEAGVTVHLLYLASFNNGDTKPADWAGQVLESLQPEPNTVLLAVASNDGNLVVAVSSNSDEWLRSQQTVDRLSQKALDPILDKKDGTPDWAGSATAMMDEIKTLKATSTGSGTTWMGVGVMGGAVALLIVGAVVVVVMRRRREADGRTGKKHGRKASKGSAGESGAKGETDAGADTEDAADADTHVNATELAEDVQETSSDPSHA